MMPDEDCVITITIQFCLKNRKGNWKDDVKTQRRETILMLSGQ